MTRRAELLVLVVGPTALAAQAAHEVVEGVGTLVEVGRVRSVEEMLAHVAVQPDVAVPLIMVTDEVGALDDVAAALVARPALAHSRLALLTERDQLDDLGHALDEDRIHEVISVPWTPGALAHRASAHLARWLKEYLPDDPRLARMEAVPQEAPDAPKAPLLGQISHDDGALTREFVDSCERVLGLRPRLHLPPGVRLTHEGASVDAVYVILGGTVALTRATRVGEVVLHHATTGRIVGILSLASQGHAFVTSTTTSDTEVVLLSVEQLDRVLRGDPEAGELLAVLLIRSLIGRLARAEILQVEKIEMAAALDAEKAHLAEALAALEEARMELLVQERFATLGELAAGVAHELNNPVAALGRAVAHLRDDVKTIVSTHPRADLVTRLGDRARTAPPASTRQERARRRSLEPVVGDRDLARRLVVAGVDDPAEARALAASPRDLALVEAAAGVGRGERNIGLAVDRIEGLVSSLHTYVRPEGGGEERVDVCEVLDDALTLVAHRLQGVEVERHYGVVGPIPGRAGELAQVWTNLLANAADALATEEVRQARTPRVILRVEAQDEVVQVEVEDNGPGIEREVLPRIFEPRFTTKHGQVRFGLGLGMGLAKSVVDAHGGTISVDSRPGRTCVTVTLPRQARKHDGPARGGTEES